MGPKFLNALFSRTCQHQFSWPMRSPDGSHYQVCSRCGDQFAYDWKSMKRLHRLEVAAVEAPEPKPMWRPRARRLKQALKVSYRLSGAVEWTEAQAENISESGLLLCLPEDVGERAIVELAFDMPREISGRPHSSCVCRAIVARVFPGEGACRAGVAITHCEYLQDRRLPASIEEMPRHSRMHLVGRAARKQ